MSAKRENESGNLFDFEPVRPPRRVNSEEAPRAEREISAPGIRVGTSAFTASGWGGTFYPTGIKDGDRLTFYATKFDTVEVDSTFYGPPSPATVKAWYAKTPPNFIFALKVPQIITHEKCLANCDEDVRNFLDGASELREKLGPILFQFGYFDRKVFPDAEAFLARLVPFLKKLPMGFRFAVEIRNKDWIGPKLADSLRARGVALALTDRSWMPRPWEFTETFDMVTADFVYVRLLGDRKGIEGITKRWEKVIVDRKPEMRSWVDYLRPIRHRGVTIFVYVNNHYAGFAPATVELFERVWKNE